MNRRIPSILSLALVCLTITAGSASATQLTWDPLNNGGVTPAGGDWDTSTNVWWNGSSDVAWTQTSTTSGSNGATFNGPDAAPGTYVVSLDGGQIAVTNLSINNNGYDFTGANSIYLGSSDFLTVAANKTVTFDCGLLGSGTSPYWLLGSGATMNVTGNIGSGQQVRLAGAAGSTFNLGGVNNPSIMFILSSVNVTNGSLIPSSSFYIGYTQTPPAPNNGSSYGTGALTISGGSTFTVNGNILIIGRSSGSGTLTISNGTVTVGSSSGNRNLAIDYDGSAGSSGTVNVAGGSLTVGGSGELGNEIAFFQTGSSAASASGTLNQSGGTITTWGGMVFGLGGGAGSATFAQTGGALYVGANGITKGSSYTGPFSITLSGGTVGAVNGNWASSLPMTLGTVNGNTTFQCANSGGNDYNISLSGALTGAGGLYVTAGSSGTGTLTLSGTNSFSGATVVSNGTLAVVTTASPTNGPVTLDGSGGGLPSVTVESNPGQYWTIGTLTFASGATTANFAFGALAPSTSVAPLQVSGSVVFTATPTVNATGAAIAVGTYPLIKYTGGVSGTMPNSATITPTSGSASGYVTNFTATKTIALVVTNSTYNPALFWAVGNGVWDTTTKNWKQFSTSTNYTDGNAVVFDDSASGPSPMTITLNSTVNPLAVTFNNAAPTNYTITGSGSISGSGSVTLLGSGTVTLGDTNSYSGGTTLSAGQLNINNGGTAAASAIGTGTLTINGGAIDNTSGSNITLQASIPETWNGNFTYVGSSNSLNTGPGQITLARNISVAVNANNLTLGSIGDNGNSLALIKTGNGTLTLSVANFFSGGLTVSSGAVALGDPSAPGQGALTIQGGAIDNSSGASLTLSSIPCFWSGSFSFLGTTNLDLGSGTVTIPNGLGGITLNVVSNTLATEGLILNNNTTVTKSGGGTWEMTGPGSGGESLGLIVTAGQVNLHKNGQAITGGNNVGMTVQGGLVVDEASFQIHSGTAVPLPVKLSGGVWDLNGWNENVDELTISGGGTLRNGAAGSTSTIDTISGYTAVLSGTNCQFDVTTNAVLDFEGVLGGSGSLVKTGWGTLNLQSNNIYTGSTVVSSGTLALPGVSSISNSAGIDLAAATSALDLSANTDTNGNPTPVLTLQPGQTLSGFGTVTGLVSAASGATVAPGSSSAVGVLSVTGISGTNSLSGVTSVKLDKGGRTNDQLSVSGGLQYGGTLALTNLSGTLAAGDSFTLFKAAGGYSGAFASISPSRPGYPGFGMAWNTNNLAVNGTLSIVSAPVPPSPKISSLILSGTTLSLQGTNGVSGEPFVVLESTNVTTPLANWVPVSTNTFDTNGDFNVPINIGTNGPQQFFRLRLQ